jgi:hypothetical protein
MPIPVFCERQAEGPAKNREKPRAANSDAPSAKSTGSPSNQNDLAANLAEMEFNYVRTYPQ